MIVTADGWCGYPTPATADGWPTMGFPVTADGWVLPDGHKHHHHHDVGGPLLRDPKKRKAKAIVPPDIREQVAKARIKAAEELATTAIGRALAEAKRLQAEAEEAARVKAEEKRLAALERARSAAAKKALAAAVEKYKRDQKAKQEAIAKAERIARQVREAAEEEARRVAADEAQKAEDEQTLEKYVNTLIEDQAKEDERIIAGLEKVIPMLTAELDELDKPASEPSEKGPTDIQRSALAALEAIVNVTRKLH